MPQSTVGLACNRARGCLRDLGRVLAGRLFDIATVLKALRPMTKGELTCLEAGQ
jgi:hypothetical protein